MTQPRPLLEPIPEATARAAHEAFPDGTLPMRIRDVLEGLADRPVDGELFPYSGPPASRTWRLALATILQVMENLTDQQAAAAARSRVDWKYALSLDLDGPAFDSAILGQFAVYLIAGGGERDLFERMRNALLGHGLLAGQDALLSDTKRALETLYNLNRIEEVGEALRDALDTLDATDPGWLRAHGQPEWTGRYNEPFALRALPREHTAVVALTEQIGLDAYVLLQALRRHPPASGANQSVFEALRLWLLKRYSFDSQGRPTWRRIGSAPPDDIDAP